MGLPAHAAGLSMNKGRFPSLLFYVVFLFIPWLVNTRSGSRLSDAHTLADCDFVVGFLHMTLFRLRKLPFIPSLADLLC